MGRGYSVRILAVVALALFAFAVHADCAADLTEPVVGQYSIADGAYRMLRRLHLDASTLKAHITNRHPVLMRESNGTAWFPWFVSKDSVLDIGYRVTGVERGGHFLITDVSRTDRQDENRYFGKLAARRDTPPMRLRLSAPIGGCAEVVVNGWTQVKMLIKHGLRLRDVQQVLSMARPAHGKIWEPNSFNGRVQWTREAGGHAIRAILAVDEGCPLTLISAYVLRGASASPFWTKQTYLQKRLVVSPATPSQPR